MNAATTSDQRVPQLRHSGVRLATQLLLSGQRDDALHVLLRSVEQQALLSGIRCRL